MKKEEYFKIYWHTVDRCKQYVLDLLPEYIADTYSLDVDDVRETIKNWYDEN